VHLRSKDEGCSGLERGKFVQGGAGVTLDLGYLAVGPLEERKREGAVY